MAESESEPEQPITPDSIESWAMEPDNLDRATKLGKRLISLNSLEDLEGLDSLGEFEDQATDWALENKFKARLLILQLLPVLMKRAKEKPDEEEEDSKTM
jgi:hypothetical protein